MHPLFFISVFWLPSLALMPQDSIPRRSVPYHRDNAHFFNEEGVFNYSTMLLREDLHLLVLGAREAVYALDLYNISNERASVKWEVTQQQIDTCQFKGKDPETECKNYIKILHKTKDGRMYVCGTNAFEPKCDYMLYVDGRLILEKNLEDGKAKCPFNPFQRHASIMDDDDLYSATSRNFRGDAFTVSRRSLKSSRRMIMTEDLHAWLLDPIFVSMAQMPKSEDSEEGDDDKVYLFFSETAVEWDYYNKLVVSRVARVCKRDIGGRRTLVNKWTSFLKARLDCPVPNSKLPYVLQDTYLWCDPQRSWKQCLFYAIFSPQSEISHVTAVCVYSVSNISKVFAEGKFKSSVTVEGNQWWTTYNGRVPTPRPGACLNDSAGESGITQTLDLPDQTLEFIKGKPLMDQAIQPFGGEPLLIHRGATFTNIIVNQAQAADGNKYHVMFFSTAKGSILKAVSYDGEMFIIEEVQLFKSPEPIKILKFSSITGQLYAGSNEGAAQMPLATCERSLTCMDCVLARDPYCGWDTAAGKCAALSGAQGELIQSVKKGDASLCPAGDAVETVNQSLQLGGYLRLHCQPLSNLAKTIWEKDDQPLTSSPRNQFIQDGLLILNVSYSDAGRYRCLSVEHSKVAEFAATVADYLVSGAPHFQREDFSVVALQATVGALAVMFLGLVAWNFYNGWNCRHRKTFAPQENLDRGLTTTSGRGLPSGTVRNLQWQN